MSLVYRHKERLAISIVRWFPRWVSPQMLSWSRVVLAIPLIYLLQMDQRWWALIVFIFAALLDYLDGPLARLTKRITTLGKLLDPLADKLIALPVIILLGAYFLPWLLIICIVGLEILLIIMSMILKPIFEALGQKRSLGANIFGKYKFTVQVILVLFMFVSPQTEATAMIATILALIAIVLSSASIAKHIAPDSHDQDKIST